MSAIADLIRGMAAAGAPPEAIALAVEAIEGAQAKDAERRAKQAERKARERERSRDSHATVTRQSADITPPDGPPPSLHPSSPPLPPPSSSLRSSVLAKPQPTGLFDGECQGESEPSGPRGPKPSDFGSAFWPAYPLKVGKLAAEKAWAQVCRRRDVTLSDILSGVERYKLTKPQDYDWAQPATWLNAGRWMDEVPTGPPRLAGRYANGAPVVDMEERRRRAERKTAELALQAQESQR